jgi:hypothetical protein
LNTKGEKAEGGGDTKPKEQVNLGNRSSQHYNKRRAFKKPMVKQPKFEGKCEELKGFICDCSDSRQIDAFMCATKEVAEHFG